MAIALVATLVAVLAAAAGLRVVFSLPPPRWQRWAWRRCVDARDRLRGRPDSGPDPFEVLRLQTRLGELSAEMRALEADRDAYAKAHRLVALRAAYDDLLAQACELAQVPIDADGRGREELRWREEQQLTERGWSW